MASFLSKFAVDGRFGEASGAYAAARNAGYTPKQISVAITQNQHGLKIGNKLKPGGETHYRGAVSTQGDPNNWLHNYQNPSGAIGMDGLMRALDSGKSVEDMIRAGQSGLLAQAGHTSSYFPQGIMGYGEAASAYLAGLRKKEKNYDNYAAPTPMNAPPPPGSRYGGADTTAGYTAQGLASPQPENYDKTTGGTTSAFGRDKRRGSTSINPAMMINPITQ